MTAAWTASLRQAKAAFPLVPWPLIAPSRGMAMQRIIRDGSSAFGIRASELVSHRRQPEMVAARALIVWGLRSLMLPPLSYPAIGTMLERDHSSIINLHQKAILLRLRSPEFSAACHRLADALSDLGEQA